MPGLLVFRKNKCLMLIIITNSGLENTLHAQLVVSGFTWFWSFILHNHLWVVFVVVLQPLGLLQLFLTSWTEACQAPLSFTISWSLLTFTSIESVMLSKHLILCCPLLLLPSVFPSIRVFFNESTLPIRWPEYWSFSFSISPSNEYSGLSYVFCYCFTDEEMGLSPMPTITLAS